MSEGKNDLAGRTKPQIDEVTTGVGKPDDYEKWLKPLYLGLMDMPGWYSASTSSEGDTMRIFLRFEQDKVKQVTFQTGGSTATSLCCFFSAELAVGKSSDELAEITGEKIIDFMGGLPQEDRHCAFLAAEALGKAVRNYQMQQQTEKHRTLRNSCLALVKPTKEQGSQKQTLRVDKIQEDCI
jgi:nitrogen fixation NifU-like protein